MTEIFDQPPNDGGIYQKRRDGKFQRIEAPTAPAKVGATHAARRNPAPTPPPTSVADWRATRTAAADPAPDAGITDSEG